MPLSFVFKQFTWGMLELFKPAELRVYDSGSSNKTGSHRPWPEPGTGGLNKPVKPPRNQVADGASCSANGWRPLNRMATKATEVGLGAYTKPYCFRKS